MNNPPEYILKELSKLKSFEIHIVNGNESPEYNYDYLRQLSNVINAIVEWTVEPDYRGRCNLDVILRAANLHYPINYPIERINKNTSKEDVDRTINRVVSHVKSLVHNLELIMNDKEYYDKISKT